MSENTLVEQLHSPDPRQRFKAIKQAARNKDLTLLDLVTELAQSDPDDQVRAVAQKARAYLSKRNVAEAEPIYRPIDKKTEEQAQSGLDAALSYHLAGQREKALKSLGKILQIAPIKATDPYFISVMNDITGQETEESLALLRDQSRIKQATVTERQLTQEKKLKQHRQDVEKSTWVSAWMDLGIYTLIVTIGTLLVVMAIGQSAAGVLSGYDAAVTAYNEALAAGEPEPTPVEPLPLEVRELAESMSGLGLEIGLKLALVAGVWSFIGIFIQLGVVHVVARLLFRGSGTLPHLIYRVLSLYNSRLPMMFFLVIIGIALAFNGGMGIVPLLLGGILALFSLALTLATIKRVGETYHFGFASGCLSVLIGSAIIGVISFVLQTLVWSSLVQLIGLPDWPL